MTFTKLFSSITESTIWCSDDHTRLVWITMLAMANKHGMVFASEPGLANRARVPLESVLRALDILQQPDLYSRSKEHEGRRIAVIDGGWHLLTYDKHRKIRDEEDRREYMRDLMRKRRAKTGNNVSNVSRSKPPLSDMLAQAEAEAEAEADKVKVAARPTLSEVANYCRERKNSVDSQKWFDHYSSNGWRVGKNPMKDWKAAVRTWERSEFNGNQSKPAKIVLLREAD